ncbi:MAG: hypothetical protein Q9187_001498 [Circinaria calcarea]
MANSTWAVSQISRLLPLDETSLTQIIDYTSGLSKEDVAEHLKNLLGDSPQALEFITSFNSRRDAPRDTSSTSQPSEVPSRPRKKKAPLNKLPPPRRPDDYGNVEGAYQKKDGGDYMPGSQRSNKQPPLANALALDPQPSARQLPIPTNSTTLTSRTASPKPPPSAAGSLISSLPNVRTTSRTSSRTSSPAPKTKIALAGGTSMHGASTTLNDLDSAIRALEIQTNPSLSTASDTSSRRCNCLATRHPLLAAAPNCLNCGKIICVKEGIGPCTFCSSPLLSQEEIQSMVRALREERGREKMDLNNSSQRRADIAKTPRAFQAPSTPEPDSTSSSSSLSMAREHKNRLLSYQAQNARRTHIIDEAADFETPSIGQSMWASPVERAAQLKRQQKVLREQEWNAKPEYEKRRMVVSVDLVGGKVVKRMGERRRSEEELGLSHNEDDNEIPNAPTNGRTGTGTGAFSKNPLLGSLIHPVWRPPKGKETATYNNDEEGEAEGEDKENRPRNRNSNSNSKSTWRRVQDDDDDNEALILDGGVYGGRGGEEERASG